ncbi:hypothetical protein D3C71_1765620 [compost metagenome]
MESNEFFGINVLEFSDEINQTSSYFQILELVEYKDGELSYLKRGVKSFDEVSIKISAYRHLLEWNPINKTVKLTKLEIESGQTYSRDSEVIFNLGYNQETPFSQYINSAYQPNEKQKLNGLAM